MDTVDLQVSIKRSEKTHREEVFDWRVLNLLFEQVVLIQEKNLRVSVRAKRRLERVEESSPTIDVDLNHCEWHIESQMVIASCIWFCIKRRMSTNLERSWG